MAINLLLTGCALTRLLEGETDAAKAEPMETVGARAEPTLVLTPGSGPVGTRVRISGTGFTAPEWWRMGGYGVSLARMIPLEGTFVCDQVAGCEMDWEIDEAGRLTSEMVIPSEGACFQTDRTEAVVPGGLRRDRRLSCVPRRDVPGDPVAGAFGI